MIEIRTTTLDDKEGAAEMLYLLPENQHLVTTGSAELIRAEADTFDKVYDYRRPLECYMAPVSYGGKKRLQRNKQKPIPEKENIK